MPEENQPPQTDAPKPNVATPGDMRELNGRRRKWPLRFGPWSATDLVVVALLTILLVYIYREHRKDTFRAAEKVAERYAAGTHPRLDDLVRAGLTGGVAAATLLALALAVFRPLWNSRLPAPVPPGATTPIPPLRWWFWTAMLAAVAAGGALRWERMDTGIYSDEAYTLRRYSMGDWEKQGLAPAVFEPATWNDTAFGNREGNNHVLFTVASRACLDAWRSLTGAGEGRFNETAIRLPAFIAGTLGIAALGLALAAMGRPGAGVAAMLFACVHPWHLRYSAEARGYGFVLLLVPLLLAFAAMALRTGAWRWWLGFGAAQFALMASFLGAIYFVAALNLALFLGVIFQPCAPNFRFGGLARLGVAGVVSLILFLPLMGPSLPQVWVYLQEDRAQGAPTLVWLFDTWCYLATGMPWDPGETGNPLLLGVLRPGPPWLAALTVAWSLLLFPVLILTGVADLWNAKQPYRWLAMALVATAPLTIAHTALSGKLLFYWYLITALPSLLIAAGAGLAAVSAALVPAAVRDPNRAERAGSHVAVDVARLALSGGLIAVFAAGIAPQAGIVMNHSRTPTRETAEAVREHAPGEPDPVSVVFWTFTPMYEPDLIVVWNAVELAESMKRAINERRPLKLGYSNRDFASRTDETRGLLKLAESEEFFAEPRLLYGIESDAFTHYVRAMKPGLDAGAIDAAVQRLTTNASP